MEVQGMVERRITGMLRNLAQCQGQGVMGYGEAFVKADQKIQPASDPLDSEVHPCSTQPHLCSLARWWRLDGACGTGGDGLQCRRGKSRKYHTRDGDVWLASAALLGGDGKTLTGFHGVDGKMARQRREGGGACARP
uniref:Uncharacterized protein n=1 Tax=Oryza glumipatula TaxID=40148 RepID=A0A0E0AZX5_9ORYZ